MTRSTLRPVGEGTRRRWRVAVLGPSRFPLARPFAGGMEAFTATLCERLRARGHHVVLFALEGSDAALADEFVPYATTPTYSPLALRDPTMPGGLDLVEHHAFLTAVHALALRGDLDVVHNNSLHHYPIAFAELLPAPLVTTLHTPPIAWLESAAAIDSAHSRYVAVSGAVARAWTTLPDVDVLPNGVDLDTFVPGPGGPDLAWAGRITPEKGTHIALEAAHELGAPLRLAGPVSDRAYFEEQVRPLLDERRVYIGHLPSARLARHFGEAAVCLVTPLWAEPFGLVAAEALACGTPVAGFAVGGLEEVVGAPEGGAVVSLPGDIARTPEPVLVEGLAAAVRSAARVPRAHARARAEREFGAAAMVSRYEALYAQMVRDARSGLDGMAG